MMVGREALRRTLCRGVLVLLAGASATACSYITPASDDSGPATNTEDTITSGSDDNEAAVTTTTVALPDPTWQRLELDLVPLAQLDQPVAFSSRSGSNNYYVAEKTGRVRNIERTVTEEGQERRVTLSGTPVLDLSETVSSGEEQGLLGLTFSSDGRLLYVTYTDLDGSLVIAEYLVSRNDQADTESRRELLRIAQPRPNHNGGAIAFGEDGFLYIGVGDGGGSGDPEGNGQNLDSLLGKILRIDPFPDGSRPYTVPDGNPFAQGGGRAEIWAWGVRNPWKIAFDPLVGDLWVADVGQNTTEEINFLGARGPSAGGFGANLGWNLMEGFLPFEAGQEPEDHTPPLHAYDHEEGRCSVTGGVVYRGELIPLLNGVYLFGDFCTGEIFGLEIKSEGTVVRRLSISSAPEQLVSFGAGPDGELLVLERSGPDGTGTVYRVEPKEPAEE